MSLVAPASSHSRLAIWRTIENQVDRWTSFGALALGVTATAVAYLL